MNRRELLHGAAALAALAALDACGSTARRTVTSSTTATNPAQATNPMPPSTIAPSSAAAASPAESTTLVPPSTAAWTPGSPALYVNHGAATPAMIALTFHFAGTPSLATKLLDLLKANGVTSTLFAIGDWLTANPALGHRALADGHELGNHTKSHQSMLKLSRAQVHAEIAGGGQALVPFVGTIGKWFRPSGTDIPNTVILEEAGKVGYPVSVGYDIDSRDYTEPGAAAVVNNVNPALHPGAIVSLHFGHTDTLTALPKILDRINTTGLHPVTITQLLG